MIYLIPVSLLAFFCLAVLLDNIATQLKRIADLIAKIQQPLVVEDDEPANDQSVVFTSNAERLLTNASESALTR